MDANSQGTKLSVKVVPKARSNEIEGWFANENGEDELKIRVTAVPDKGQANKAVIDVLSKNLKIGKSKILLLQGTTSRNKVFLIQGVTMLDIKNILQ